MWQFSPVDLRKIRSVSVLASLFLFSNDSACLAHPIMSPIIEGEWWQIAGDPDLGNYTDPKQQPVDFAIWQAGDGRWQLWSCIRGSKCGGKTRLFHRWEGAALTN